MAQVPPQMPFDLSKLPPDAMSLMKKEMQRRFSLFLVGAVVTIVGLFLNGPPPYLPTLVMVGGGAVAILGLFGLARGSGCFAIVLFFFWLGAVACGVSRGSDPTVYILGLGALGFALLAQFAPKPKATGPLANLQAAMQAMQQAQQAAQQQGRGGPGGPPAGGGNPGFGSFPFAQMGDGKQRPARDRVIDVNAEETKKKK
ncbi:hypothetical protein [Nannocystis pusilla]|uniref:hypothetical protein n=1 Tax=Nannocystis pusilla TaxID=889268 RepID=UPI003DA36406